MKATNTTLGINDFALNRHKAEEPYSHYEGSNEELLKLAESGERTNLAPDGSVFKITLPGNGFLSGSTQVTPETTIVGVFGTRPYAEPGEYPYLSFKALDGTKEPAVEADLICYTKAKLAENNEGTTDADAEMVSLNAKRFVGKEPIHPVTALRNARGYPGGTKATYTVDELLDAIEHHYGGGPKAPYIMLGPKA